MDIKIIPGEKIGQTLLRYEVLSERHLKNILIRQKHGDSRKFGQIAVALKYLKPNIMSRYLRSISIKAVKEYASDNKNHSSKKISQLNSMVHKKKEALFS